MLSGCASTGQVAPSPAALLVSETEPNPEAERPWRAIIAAPDLARLDQLGDRWQEALALARSAGFARRVRQEGELLDPAVALPRASLPPGSYRCRLIRIGAARRGRGAFKVLGPYFCYVGADGETPSFTQQTGSERPGGYLYDDSDQRQVLIGATARGRDKVPPAYREQRERDVVGIAERIGNFRYRLVVPPANGALLDVYELVPAPG